MNLLLHNPQQSQYTSLKNYKNIARTLTSTDILVLGKLFKIHAYYTNINISQLRIAHELAIHPVTVCKIIAKLVRYKFISKTVAKFKQTCTYFFNPIFNNPKSVSILSEVLGFLKKSFSLSQFLHFKEKYSTAKLTISSLSINILPVVSKTKICKKTTTDGEIFFKKFPKRKELGSMDGIEISEELKLVTQKLNLTKWGQLKLSVFPDHILKQALSELRLAREARNNFGWFISVAIKACDREKIRPNWQQYDFLKEKYQQPENAKMVMPSDKAPNRILKREPLEKSLSVSERCEYLRKEIEHGSKVISDPEKYLGFAFEYSLAFVLKSHKINQDELALLESNEANLHITR